MRPEARFPALAHRDFTLLWIANVVSRIGTQMRDVALAWHIYVLTKSPLALGLLGAFRIVPILVLAMLGGITADALDRRKLLIATQSILTLTAAAMALCTKIGIITPSVLYTLVAISAAATAFDNPARQALVVNLLPEKDLPNGLTLGILGWQTATVVGPAVGGILLAATSITTIYAIDTISFLAVIGALIVIRPYQAQGVQEQESGSSGVPERSKLNLGAMADVFRFLRTDPALIWLMILDFFATFFAGSLLLLPIFAEEIFRTGARGLGLLSSAPAVGAVMASLWLSSRGTIVRQGPWVLGAVLVYGASIAAFGLTGSFPLALVFLAISGAADTVSTVIRQVVRQTHTPDVLRGRMTAVNMMFFMGGPQLGEVEAGFVAHLTSARVSVVSGGVACMVVAVIVTMLVSSLRTLRLGRPDIIPSPR